MPSTGNVQWIAKNRTKKRRMEMLPTGWKRSEERRCAECDTTLKSGMSPF